MLWVQRLSGIGNTIPASENVATGVPRSRVFRGVGGFQPFEAIFGARH